MKKSPSESSTDSIPKINPDGFERIRDRRSCKEDEKRLKEALQEREGKPPAPGDVYHFDLRMEGAPEGTSLYFVVLHPHPKDENMLFVVPADTSPLTGSCDMGVSDEAIFGPLNLCLGKGIWLPIEIFSTARRSGVVEDHLIEMACSVHSRLVSGEWKGSEQQFMIDEDPYYQEHDVEMDACAGAMRAYLEEFMSNN